MKSLLLVGVVFLSTAAAANDRVLAIFTAHCAGCHGGRTPSERKGGFDFVLDLERLVRSEMIIPGKPRDSYLFKRFGIEQDMPPKKTDDLSSEIAVVEKWIFSLAEQSEPTREGFSDDRLFGLIEKDLLKLPTANRARTRYVTFDNLFLAKVGSGPYAYKKDAVDLRKKIFRFVLNSVSWRKKLLEMEGVDSQGLVFRLTFPSTLESDDVPFAERGIGPQRWERLGQLDPYRRKFLSKSFETISQISGSKYPVLRADVFVALATSPLYYELLGFPSKDTALESLLQINVATNLKTFAAHRAGTSQSGVSRNNRVIEAHPTKHGYYWKSYDFASNADRKNIFANPLGPSGLFPGLTEAFAQDGGEAIFNLPNQLQAYYVANADGVLIDRAPVDIVSDTRKNRAQIENPINCMGCHRDGLNPMRDEIARSVQNPKPGLPHFSEKVVETVTRLFAQPKLDAALKSGTSRYRSSVREIFAGQEFDVIGMVDEFQFGRISLATAAAELRLSSQALETLITRIVHLSENPEGLSDFIVQRLKRAARELSALTHQRTVERKALQDNFALLEEMQAT